MSLPAMSFVRCRSTLLFLFMTLTVAAAKPGFFLTTHKSIIPGSKLNVCIIFVGVTSEITVEYEFRRPQTSLYDNIYAGGKEKFSAEGGCKEFSMPVTLPAGLMELVVNGYTSEDQPDSYVFNGTTQLKVFHRIPEFTIIQTDKPVYKPGQTVRIRLVTLLFNLSAVTTGAMNVSIKNPDGIDIERWDAVSRSTGIVDLSLQLAEEPRIGTYLILCDADGRTEWKNFTVLQYVLPRVEVIHRPKDYFVRDTTALQGEVCARYTFLGGYESPSLKGLLTARFSVVKVVNNSRVMSINDQPLTITDEINGCYLYNVSAKDLKIDWHTQTLENLRILASVNILEHGTGITTKANDALIRLESTNTTISIIGDDTYKPILPYSFKVKINYRTGQSSNAKNISIGIGQDNAQVIQRTEVTNVDGYAFVTENPPYNLQDFTITATLRDEMTGFVVALETKRVTSWYSPSGRYLKLRVPKDGYALSCNSEQTIDFDYTTTDKGEGIDLNIQVIGKSNILESRRVHVNFVPAEDVSPRPFQVFAESCATGENASITTSASRGSDSILLSVTSAMSPSAKLIVFYISQDGEVVADSIDIRVKECTQNAVKMSFSKFIVRPGREIHVDLSAAAGSFCTYGVIDRSVDLLSNGKLLDLSDVFEMAQARIPVDDHWVSKVSDYMKHATQCRSLRLSRNSLFITSTNLTDSRYSFLMGKTVVLTDVQVDTRKCFCRIKAFSSRARTYNYAPSDAENEIISGGTTYEPSVLIRDYFPETWLWDAVFISDSGRKSVTVRAPHSMTSWRGKAMCVHSSLGFGISPVATLTTFQRFFLRVRLPYSVIRGESVPIVVKAHNYYEDCFAIRVSIQYSSHFEITEGNSTLCVCGPRPETLVFRLVPRSLGVINITITAREEHLDHVANDCPPNATMSRFTGIQDAVVKNLLVEAEGQREEYVQSAYVCAQTGESSRTLTMEFTLPESMVSDSARGTVSVVGDLLGVTLANLQVLVIQDTDCGEQSMVKFAPAVFIIRYLKSTGQLVPELESSIINQLKAGYQKQVTFMQRDGGFSYYSHTSSNVWLTAYIVKCFIHATRYVPVVRNNIEASLMYLRRSQLSDGCFSPNETDRFYSRLAAIFTGTSIDKLKIRITAYVAISMLEAGVSTQDAAVSSAISCLERPSDPDIYGLAMTAYAFSLHDWRSPRRLRAMKDLQKAGTAVGSEVLGTTGNTKHWVADPSQGIDAPINIEATAFALLAILQEPGKTLDALPVVNWIMRRQNARGGYTSTQDTVVAIQALAAYAEATYLTNINTGVIVNITMPEFSRSFEVNTRNQLVVQTAELSTLRPGNLTYEIIGAGCAVVQAKAIYSVKSERQPNTYFHTTVKPYFKESANAGDNCTHRLIHICSRYTGRQGDASAMTIIDVRMISGWTPDIPSLEALYANRTLQLMRYTQNNQHVSLHFLQITKEFLCLTFEAIRTHNVRARPGRVSTYEYYSPAHRNDIEFTLQECVEDDSEDSNSMESLTDCTNECADDIEIPNSNLELCPTCSQPRDFSRLCQYMHVLKAQFSNDSSTGEEITIINDLKNKYRSRQAQATLMLPRSCSCEVFDDTNLPFMIAYNNTVTSGRRRAPVLHLSSKDIYIFTATRGTEEKTASALRRCTN